MRVFLSAILLSAPIALAAVPASADQMIQELRSTQTQPATGAESTAAPATEQAAQPVSQATRRHRVAGSHYEREHLKTSQVHG
jgi:hypothetical protein